MFINATGAEYVGFNPANTGMALPPVGVYPNLKLQIANSQEGMTKGDPSAGKQPMGKLDITFDILSGTLEGQQFKLTYNTGHHNPQTASIAVKNILSLVYAITGIDYTGKQFNFDKALYNHPFTGTLEVTNQATLDNNGNPFRNANLKGLKMFDYIEASKQPVAANSVAQVPVTTDRPSWAGPQG